MEEDEYAGRAGCEEWGREGGKRMTEPKCGGGGGMGVTEAGWGERE